MQPLATCRWLERKCLRGAVAPPLAPSLVLLADAELFSVQPLAPLHLPMVRVGAPSPAKIGASTHSLTQRCWAILGLSHRHPSCAGGQKWRHPFSLSPRCLHFAHEPWGPPDRSRPNIGKGFELGPCFADGTEECSEGLACFGDQHLLRSVLTMVIAIDAKHKKSDS